MLSLPWRHFFRIELLDTKTSATIFVSQIGLILLRHHFVFGLRPKIVYEGRKTKSPNHPELDDGSILWQLIMKNNGLGSAIFLDYKFNIGINNVETSDKYIEHDLAVRKLEDNGFNLEEDYFLFNITKGYTIPAKDEKVIFEIKLPKGYSLKQVDICMVFCGFLGGRYEKYIYAIPRLGIFNKKSNQ